MAEAAATLEHVRAYLERPRCAVLSTIGPDGAPHQAVVHYWLDGDAVLVNGRSDRRWLRNLRRDPRVSLVVHDAERPLHWIGIKGRAHPTDDGPAAVADAMALARRYGEDPDQYAGQDRVTMRILPRRVYEYG